MCCVEGPAIHTYPDPRTDLHTPDQMNVDALIKSGYLTHTLSDSDGQQEPRDQPVKSRGQPDRDVTNRVLGASIDQGNLSTVRSSLGGTGQFTITESLGQSEGLVFSQSESRISGADDRRDVIVHMPSATHETDTETAEDVSEISIT